MTTLRAGDLVRAKDQTADQQEMTVTSISGSKANVAWFDADGNHNFKAVEADQLMTSVEAAAVARVQNERARNRIEQEQAAEDLIRAEEAAAEAANIAHTANEGAE